MLTEWSPLLNVNGYTLMRGLHKMVRICFLPPRAQPVGRLLPYRTLNEIEWKTVVAASYVCDPNGHAVPAGHVEVRDVHAPRIRGDSEDEILERSHLLSRQGDCLVTDGTRLM